MNNALEFLARQYDNVVKYDKDGNPTILVRLHKMKSSDLDPSLPDHTHPAFIINGVEQDEILIGKFKASEYGKDGKLASLPNVPPRVSLGADAFLTRMRAFGNGASGMTVADAGFILLLAQKNGWDPKGNNYYSCDYRDGTPWTFKADSPKTATVGSVYVFHGWEYECLIEHTIAVELRPDKSSKHWKKKRHIGGTPADPNQYNADNYYQGYNTLNGSGPNSWYLDGTPGSLCDIQGNCYEQNYGYRLVRCELQIMENNNAADPEADLSASSAAWKAILPNKTDDGFTLVAPGTPGTLHWNWLNGKITLDTVEPTFDNEYRGTDFAALAVNTANLPYVPHIVRELGLFPTQGSSMRGYYYIHFTTEERFPRRGGYYDNASLAGLGYVDCSNARSDAGASYGARPRSLV